MTTNRSNRISSPASSPAPGVATGLVGEGAPAPASELEALAVFIGNWLNEGHTVAAPGAPSVPIRCSDVYEWAPGGRFVLHTAYGQIGTVDVGGVEIIGWDAAEQTYRSEFFDSQGNVSVHTLAVVDGVWSWTGTDARCTALFEGGGVTQIAHHERRGEGGWRPSMEVTLTRVS